MNNSGNDFPKKSLKKKILLGVIIVALIVSSTPFGLNIINAQTTPILSLTPSEIPTQSQSLSIGDTFELALHVEDITNLFAWSIGLEWDPDVLEMTGPLTEGPFLKNEYSTIWLGDNPNNTQGILIEQSCTVFGQGEVSGSGDLATMEFKIIGYGHSDIELTSDLKDYGSPGNHNPITHTPLGATFELTDSSNGSNNTPASSDPHGPEAIISPANRTTFFVDDLIVLSAASSKDGYDTEGKNETCPITAYTWLVQYQNGTLLNSFSGETISFSVDSNVTLRAILTVTAPDPTSPSNSAFTSVDTVTSTFFVEEAGDVTIDLYTNKGGTGDSVNSSSFGPRELIDTYALIKFDGVPVENQDVAFELASPNGTVTAVRVVRTNSSGHAYTDFRLPWPGPNPSDVFGTWTITASVDIFQYSVVDDVHFTYDYFVTTEFIEMPAYSERSKTIPINVTINTKAELLEWTTVTITVYDVVEVPIGFFTIENIDQEKGETIITASVFIPDWAFVGQATVYVNVLTDFPGDGGVPYCEEMSTTFLIQA